MPSDQKNDIEFLIATLPDPVHTHMALWFDRWIDAIEKAAQAEGYLFSRAWMPWDVPTHPESTDFTVRMAQAKASGKQGVVAGTDDFSKPPIKGPIHPVLFSFLP